MENGMKMLRKAIVGALACLGLSASADQAMSLDELMQAFGWDFETAEIRTQKVTDNLHVLFGLGGNIGVSVGADGVLIVDDQFPELIPQINAAIAELGGGAIDYAVNTHWHFDHAEGNLALGPAGTTLVSHSLAREDMAKGGIINLVQMQYRQQPYPAEALPAITYDDRMQLHFNGEVIELVHAGPAHTTGDTAVIFRGSNAVHFGDVFNNTGYPFIDADSGGEIDGMIAFCRAIADELPRDAVIIPGHGEVTDYDTLEAYIAMLETVRERVASLMAEGKSLEEVAAANVTQGLEEDYGDESASLGFVNRVYTSLAKAKGPTEGNG